MNLKNGWRLITDNHLELKLFSNVENSNELVVRDKNDTGHSAHLSFRMQILKYKKCHGQFL